MHQPPDFFFLGKTCSPPVLEVCLFSLQSYQRVAVPLTGGDCPGSQLDKHLTAELSVLKLKLTLFSLPLSYGILSLGSSLPKLLTTTLFPGVMPTVGLLWWYKSIWYTVFLLPDQHCQTIAQLFWRAGQPLVFYCGNSVRILVLFQAASLQLVPYLKLNFPWAKSKSS